MAKQHLGHLQKDIDQFVASVAVEMVDKRHLQEKMVDKWSIKPSLAEKLSDIMAFMADKEQIKTEELVKGMNIKETTAKRYLRQLIEYGYLEAHGGNKNRYYTRNKGI